jgi:cysteine synthase
MGIGLSRVCRSRGHKLAIYMPNTQSSRQDRPVKITGRGRLPRSRRSVGGRLELQLADEETCGATAKAGLLKDPRRLSHLFSQPLP